MAILNPPKLCLVVSGRGGSSKARSEWLRIVPCLTKAACSDASMHEGVFLILASCLAALLHSQMVDFVMMTLQL